MEGLGQVVVRARVEPLDPLADVAQRGDEQDGGGNPAGAELAQDGDAVHDREHPVEQDEVVRALPGPAQAVVAVVADVDLEPLLVQREGDRLAQLHIVLYEQNPHIDILRAAGSPTVTVCSIARESGKFL